MRWRDPNLTEVISFLNNPNNVIKANAAAYLQHLCYMDDPNKQRTRTLGGIPPLVKLLAHDGPEVGVFSVVLLRERRRVAHKHIADFLWTISPIFNDSFMCLLISFLTF